MRIVSLETNDDILMAGCNKVEFFESKYFVLDKQFSNLLVFDQDGNYLYRIGKLGGGPGEYQSIYGFELDLENRNVLVYSLDNQAVFKYTLEGEYISKVTVDFYGFDFYLASNGQYIFNSRYNNDGKYPQASIFVTNADGKVQSNFFEYPNEATQMVMSMSGFSTVDGNKGYFNHAFSDTVYQFNLIDNTVEAAFGLSLGKDQWDKGFNFSKIFGGSFVEHNYLSSAARVRDGVLYFLYMDSEVLPGQPGPGQTPKMARLSLEDNSLITSSTHETEFILKYGIGIPKGFTNDGKLITSMTANQLGLVQRNYPEAWEASEQRYPELLQIEKVLKDENNPVIITFEYGL